MLVFDATALIALFQAHPIVMDLWQRADRAEESVVFPVGAMAEANMLIRAGNNAWERFLLAVNVEVLPMSGHAAIEMAELPGTMATRHVLHEAMALQAAVVTQEPDRYPHDLVELLVI